MENRNDNSPTIYNANCQTLWNLFIWEPTHKSLCVPGSTWEEIHHHTDFSQKRKRKGGGGVKSYKQKADEEHTKQERIMEKVQTKVLHPSKALLIWSLIKEITPQEKVHSFNEETRRKQKSINTETVELRKETEENLDRKTTSCRINMTEVMGRIRCMV